MYRKKLREFAAKRSEAKRSAAQRAAQCRKHGTVANGVSVVRITRRGETCLRSPVEQQFQNHGCPENRRYGVRDVPKRINPKEAYCRVLLKKGYSYRDLNSFECSAAILVLWDVPKKVLGCPEHFYQKDARWRVLFRTGYLFVFWSSERECVYIILPDRSFQVLVKPLVFLKAVMGDGGCLRWEEGK